MALIRPLSVLYFFHLDQTLRFSFLFPFFLLIGIEITLCELQLGFTTLTFQVTKEFSPSLVLANDSITKKVNALAGVPISSSGVVTRHSKLPSRIWRCKDIRFGHENERITGRRIQCIPAKHSSNRHFLLAGKELSYKDSPQEPFWLSLIREAIWAVKSLSVFLVEQPSQLKYIE